jgi:hemerythrin-like domain-containing protein
MRDEVAQKGGGMALRHRIQYLRREHEALLHLVDGIDKMLALASKNEFAARSKGLIGLRSLEHGLGGVVEHCHAEDRIVESTFHHSLPPDERTRIAVEHKQVLRAVTDFREELKFATADRTLAMIPPAVELVNRLRAHIAYEREMLDRIVPRSTMRRGTMANKRTSRRVLVRRSKEVRKHKTPTRAAHNLPYTLEWHPEL